MHEAGDLPGGERLVHALRELPVGAHAPVCLDPLLTRELHSGHLEAIPRLFFAFKGGRVLICVNTRNPALPDK
jgi:hypothetical protein